VGASPSSLEGHRVINCSTRSSISPFFIGNDRAMVSLGPLSSESHCSYHCAFCYVQKGFNSYAKLSVDQIVNFLKPRKSEFSIIYVSGDTDSFAPPRTEEGLALLEALSESFDCDLMFTTRTVFNEKDLKSLKETQETVLENGHFLFGCESITRLRSVPQIEPKPIPSPEARIEMLRAFWRLGLISVLTMRPFLPVVPVEEYREIINICRPFVDIVLGEVLYMDPEGVVERRLFPNGAPENLRLALHKMDFDDNGIEWKVWEAKRVEREVRDYCNAQEIPFFMRSRPAVEYIRKKGLAYIRQRSAS